MGLIETKHQHLGILPLHGAYHLNVAYPPPQSVGLVGPSMFSCLQ